MLTRLMKRFRKSESGQGMTEYIIIVALIAIAAIGIVTIFGENIRGLFSASSNALSGETNVEVQTKGGNKVQSKDLKNFAKKNKGNL